MKSLKLFIIAIGTQRERDEVETRKMRFRRTHVDVPSVAALEVVEVELEGEVDLVAAAVGWAPSERRDEWSDGV